VGFNPRPPSVFTHSCTGGDSYVPYGGNSNIKIIRELYLLVRQTSVWTGECFERGLLGTLNGNVGHGRVVSLPGAGGNFIFWRIVCGYLIRFSR